MKFFRCKLCGQIVGMIKETGVPMICCGEEMEEIVPLTKEEGLTEKHVPVFKVSNNKVITNIGSIPHPTTSEHHIEWVALVTSKGNQRKCLKPGDAPSVMFMIDDDEEVQEIYAYCNLHSLWKAKVSSK